MADQTKKQYPPVPKVTGQASSDALDFSAAGQLLARASGQIEGSSLCFHDAPKSAPVQCQSGLMMATTSLFTGLVDQVLGFCKTGKRIGVRCFGSPTRDTDDFHLTAALHSLNHRNVIFLAFSIGPALKRE